MEAGRELDVLVAEKVMGWKHVLLGGWNETWYPPDLHPLQNVIGHTIPSYSTDIAAAWQVVEKLKKNEWHAFIIALMASHVGKDRLPLNVFSQVLFDLTPHAICLAAIKAVGVKIDG